MTSALTIRKHELEAQTLSEMLRVGGSLAEKAISNPTLSTILGLVLIQQLENRYFLVKLQGNQYYRVPFMDHVAGGTLQGALASKEVVTAVASAANSVASIAKLFSGPSA